MPVSVKTLKEIGDTLIEIHGQFENHSLLDPATHRKTLDAFGGYDKLLDDVRGAYNELYSAETRLRELTEILEKSAAEREFLEHNIAELRALKPQVGEEEDLANRRAAMMSAEKNAAILSDAVQGADGLDAQIFAVAHILERIKTDPNPYAAQIEKLYAAADIVAQVSDKLTPPDTDAENLEEIEERLFAIRAAARKHRVSADELSEKFNQMTEQLNAIDNSDAELKKAKTNVAATKKTFDDTAKKLTDARITASAELRKQILRELPDLKLGAADFEIQISPGAPGANGVDDVVFMVRMNPGAAFAPLHKTASGGELARLMLALRVILAADTGGRTFVFDEVDTGISGATAAAVGERLARLADTGQALVITHSAQVAGFANKHFKIEKYVSDNKTTTTVCEITDDVRINEIARIISGEKITDESIATAKTLIKS